MIHWRSVGSLLLLVLSVIVGVSGAAAQSNTARVRIVHAAPDAAPVDVLLDGTVAARNIAFASIGEYLDVPAGEHTITLVPTGQSSAQAVLSTDATFAAGAAYTVVAIGINDLSAAVFEDNLTPPAEGQARVRFIHTSPDAPGVDIEVFNGPTLFTNIGFGEASAYQDVAADTYDLRAVTTGANTVIVQLPQTSVEAGTIYDVIAVGRLANLQVQVGTFTPSSDAAADARAGAAATPSNLMPSTGAMDYRELLLGLALLAIAGGWAVLLRVQAVRR